MGIVQKDAFRTTVISYIGILLGYINKGLLFIIILTEEQIGLISLLIAVGTLFAQLSGFGTAFTTLKFLPIFKNSERQHYGFFSFVFRMIIWGTIITSVGFILLRPFIENLYIDKSPEFVDYYWWIFPIGIGYVFYLLFEAYLRSFYRNILSVFSYEILLRLGVTVSLMLYWSQNISFDSFVKINSLIYLLPPLILMIYLSKQNELVVSTKNIDISKRFQRLMTQFSTYNYINSLGVVLVVSLDVMMIAQMMGAAETGVYATVVFVASALLVPSRSLVRISAPLVSEYWKSRKMSEMNSLYKKTGAVSLFLGLSGFIVIWLNIDLLFSFLKPEFQPGIWVFFTLMLGRFFELFFGLTGIIFSTSKKYKYDIYFTLLLVVLVFGLNLVFIPKWGIVGASVSTAIALMIYNVGRFLFIYKSYGLNPFEKNQFIVIGLAVVTLLTGEYFGQMTDDLFTRVFVVVPIFFILFIVPVFVFKLEPQITQYINNKVRLGIKKKED
jgi:O-antigen/teichoic acid export membrane protein